MGELQWAAAVSIVVTAGGDPTAVAPQVDRPVVDIAVHASMAFHVGCDGEAVPVASRGER